MKKGIVPRLGIDTDARWDYSHTNKGWIFGYKLNMVSSTGSSIIVPLSAADDITQLPMYKIIRSMMH
jgi:hypothetical protein